MQQTGGVVVIGCGNLNRSDDGVGVVVVQRLREWVADQSVEGVRVFDAGTGGMDVMFQARGATTLILVDACVSGSPPGSIFKMPGDALMTRPEPGYSLHDFRWEHALYAGRKIFADAFPARVTVYLVEAGDVSMGLDVTPPVREAVDKVLGYIRADIVTGAGIAASPTASSATAMPAPLRNPHQVRIRRGSLYLDVEVYREYFDGLDGVVILRRDEGLLILPVRHAAGGGLLLKVRNIRGDRVVHAQEFFREQGIEENREWRLPVRWDRERAALVVPWPLRASAAP